MRSTKATSELLTQAQHDRIENNGTGGCGPLMKYHNLLDCPFCKFGTVDVKRNESVGKCADCGAIIPDATLKKIGWRG